ncbi:MAG: Aldo/keto reductase [Betaproteobacteria bacterium]|nr:Aldo/keto reductase [Betaproteobacteria bacterium]
MDKKTEDSGSSRRHIWKPLEMKYRHLGKAGPMVSAIGLGRGSQAVKFGEPLEYEFNETVRRAIDAGITLFDSSDLYWNARHEVLLGRAVEGRRHKILITTKFGNIDLPDGKKGTNGRPEYVMSSCEASLQRLGLECIDIYFMHRIDPNTPIEDTVGAMSRLVEQGKVRYIGLCEAGPDTLRRAHRVHPLAALQTEYSLWARDCETEILPACRELGIAYMAYAPLGRGLLTGSIKTVDDLPQNDRRRRHSRFQPENLKRNAELVAQLGAMADQLGVTAAQLALAWLLAQGEDIVPIPGTNHVNNLNQNMGAVNVQLSQDDVRKLNAMFAPGKGAGTRYSETALKGLGI